MIHLGDCLEVLKKIESDSIDCVVTSPPYNKKGLCGQTAVGDHAWKKFNIDYNEYGDDLPEEEYQQWQITLLNELKRIIKPTGSIFYNHKPRRNDNICRMPLEFIYKSELDLYQLIVWNRKNSPNIRNDILIPCTEHIYWLTKGKPKTFRSQVMPEYRSEVWEMIPGRQDDHPAPFPEQLVENCVKLTTEKRDIVLDPFFGSGTTGVVCEKIDRQWIGVELDKKYKDIAERRIQETKDAMKYSLARFF